jgi:transcriptional regulator with XRE-family HTH domain
MANAFANGTRWLTQPFLGYTVRLRDALHYLMRSTEHDRLYRLIGDRIRAARERLGMTQTALAAKLRLSRVSVVNIECGRQRPPIHVLWQIGEHLGSEVSAFIPQHREYLEDSTGVHLDAHTVSQIEAAAKGDPATNRKLTEFIRMAKTTSRRGNGDTKS